MSQHQNRLLSCIPAAVFEALRPHLSPFELKLGDVIAETRGTIDRVYFPHSGIISLVVELAEGDLLETAMVGRDGVMGASSALDGKVSLNKAIVQAPGVASVVRAEKILELAKAHDVFRSILIRHDQVLFAQAQQAAACNASHTVEARLCRWLLRMRDLAGDDDLPLTQEFLGRMLGVRRSSVSLVAATLQQAGLIRYSRGHIRILNIDGLRDASCECYETVKAHYDLLCTAR
jgi:CRP-like cAMP-binding protein